MVDERAVSDMSGPSEAQSGITYPGATDAPLGMALGGIGTSTLEIGRDGVFQNIRIQNCWCDRIRPTPPGTFLSVHAREQGAAGGTGRVLQLDTPGGLPPIAGLTYTGRFPFAELAYSDPDIPCELRMEAFSPFVPLDSEASSLPLVFFTFQIHNPVPVPLTVSTAISWTNDMAYDPYVRAGYSSRGNRNTALEVDSYPAVLMDSTGETMAGNEMLLACLPSSGVRLSAVVDWWQGPPGRWMGPNFGKDTDRSLTAWQRFLCSGRLPEESDYDDGLGPHSVHQPVAAVAGEVDLKPGETAEVRFALVWYFPEHCDGRVSTQNTMLKNRYAVRFPGGVRDVAEHSFGQSEQLRRRSGAWRSLIEESSLPPKTRALATEILYLLPRLTWWLADGRFCMYESINCPRMNAVILDIYVAPVLAVFFPDLHAQLLRTTAGAQLSTGEIPSTLGRSGSITHHEYRVFSPGDVSVFPITVAWQCLWSDDAEFARDMYPVMKKVLQWGKRDLDQDGDGIPDVHGIDQGWDTFPMLGLSGYIANQWIAGLLAGELLARRFGDDSFARWCRETRQQASETVERLLWNGEYYNLSHNYETGVTSDICFADQFTYGTVAANILQLGNVHPYERVARALEAMWRLNVEPCKFGSRMGSHPDGSPADSTVHKHQEGGASQSNAFTPVSTAPLAAALIQYGYVDKGLALAEEMSSTIIDVLGEPWSARLLFSSDTAEWFYGDHYSDCLIHWDILHALLGVHLDIPAGELELAPPRIPVRAPVISSLYYGQVEFACGLDGVTVTLTSVAEVSALIGRLTLLLPGEGTGAEPQVIEGTVAGKKTVPGGIAFSDVAMASDSGRFVVCWTASS